jgi:hypothetical protein
MAQICNPSYLEGRGRKIIVQGQPWQKKKKKKLSKNKPGVMVHI